MILTKSTFEELKTSFRCENDPLQGKGFVKEISKDDFTVLSPGEEIFKLAAKAKVREILESNEVVV